MMQPGLAMMSVEWRTFTGVELKTLQQIWRGGGGRASGGGGKGDREEGVRVADYNTSCVKS
jgi:hypothetical protein